MNLINILIVSLVIINLFLIKNKRFPIIKKVLPWIIVILFSYHWGVGGLIQYPFLANVVGIIVISFWFIVITQYLRSLYMNKK
ncbi:hypothetical protein A499_18239 [Niallia nealsonii AAU1]|nr:hypothetical protein A499_18239 [Niallia nealsonii AAU1]